MQRRGERARAPGDQRGAAVGRELAVARERLHQQERDRRRPPIETRKRIIEARGCRRRRRGRRRTGTRTGRSSAAIVAKKLASVITSTSRWRCASSSWAITPSSSAGVRSSMIPVVAQTVACLGERPDRERVRHRACRRPRPSAWACRPGRRGARPSRAARAPAPARPPAAPIARRASLSEPNSWNAARPPATIAIVTPLAPEANSATIRIDVDERRAGRW